MKQEYGNWVATTAVTDAQREAAMKSFRAAKAKTPALAGVEEPTMILAQVGWWVEVDEEE